MIKPNCKKQAVNLTHREYSELCSLHNRNVKKYNSMKKRIGQMIRKTKELQEVLNELANTNLRNSMIIKLYEYQESGKHADIVGPYKSRRNKVDYTVSCITWCKENDKHLKFMSMSDDEIIETCHKLFHSKLLKGYTFTLDRECTHNGCMEWTYGSRVCKCGKTKIAYDHNIDYGYNKDISIFDAVPLYRILF